jgi:hypothetical protein
MRFVNPGGRIVQALKNPGTFTVSIHSTWNVFDRFLSNELIEARDEKRLLRLQHQLAGYKLLIIDELGYVPLSQTGAELLFEVFKHRPPN